MPTKNKDKKILTWDVRCNDVSDKTNSTKKAGIKTMMKMTFVNKTDNEDVKISLSIKAKKNQHPFRNLSKNDAMKLKEGLVLKLEYPKVKQKKITDV